MLNVVAFTPRRRAEPRARDAHPGADPRHGAGPARDARRPARRRHRQRPRRPARRQRDAVEFDAVDHPRAPGPARSSRSTRPRSTSSGRTGSPATCRSRWASSARRRRASWSRESPVADPEMVRARGAEERGPRRAARARRRVRRDGADRGKYTRQLAIDRPPGRVTYDASSVAATIEIGREVTERLFTQVPVATFGHVAAKAQPAEVDVRLTCPPEVVRALRAEQIVPRVQATGAGRPRLRAFCRWS